MKKRQMRASCISRLRFGIGIGTRHDQKVFSFLGFSLPFLSTTSHNLHNAAVDDHITSHHLSNERNTTYILRGQSKAE